VSFLVLAPLCIVLGAMFPAAVRLAELNHQQDQNQAGTRERTTWINRTYILESVGFIIGGLVFNFALVPYVNAWTVAGITAGMTLVAAWWVGWSGRHRRILVQGIFLAFSTLVWCGLVWCVAIGSLEFLTQKLRWHGFNLVRTMESPYGNLAVTRERKQISFYENGLLVATIPAPSTSEPFFHLPLLLHSNPRRVLVLGGGIEGGLGEILKHPVDTVDYVSLDPQLVKLVMNHLSPAAAKTATDSRVKIRYEDGCGYVRRLAALPLSERPRYDLIFLALPDPSTAMLNRAYSLEFFTAARKLMPPDGILALELAFSETYVGSEMRKLNGSIFKTLHRVFSQVLPVPEYTVLWLASPTVAGISLEVEPVLQRFEKRGIKTEYLKPAMVYHKLDRARIADRLNFLLSDFSRLFQSPDPLREELMAWETDPAIPINHDFRPVSYYLQILLWTSKYSRKMAAFLELASQIRPGLIIVIVLGIFTLIGLFIRLGKRSPERLVIPIVVLSNGFTAMVIEVLLLFSFQVLTGYVFGQVALIISLFMAGLAAGSIISSRLLVPRKRPVLFLLGSEAGIAVFVFLTPVVLRWGTKLASSGNLVPVKILVAGLVIVAGILDGLEFPLGSSLMVKRTPKTGTAAGIVYGADLTGSFLGALLASSLLLPVFGLGGTCMVLAALKIGSLIMLSGLTLRKRQ
ncbi:MAG: hypothetical protein QGH40_01465, partial [bacterium]|nr:hypothetical protein [bacterium]